MTYYIIKDDQTIFSATKFNKEQLQTLFDAEAEKLANGQELEFGKMDKKYFYPCLLYVFKKDNKLWTLSKSGKHKEYTRKRAGE